MKANPFIFLIVILAMTSILISMRGLKKGYRAENRARKAEDRAKKAEVRAKKAEVRAKEAEVRAKKADGSAKQVQRCMGLLRLAEIIRNTVTREDRDDFQNAVNMRNTIHQQVPLKKSLNGSSPMDFDISYLESLRDDAVGHICGGLSSTYATALESQGIPARYVGFFSKDKQPYDSHATIEFWHGGKWHASDPTFNAMFKSQGEYLSYSQLYALIENGGGYEVVSNGFPVTPERAIENHYVKLEDLMGYMVVHPGKVWPKAGTAELDYPMELFPDTWDGKITYDDGKRRDVKNFSELYEYLNKGPLR